MCGRGGGAEAAEDEGCLGLRPGGLAIVLMPWWG